MADKIFRIFNPKEPKADPVEKRRAQLRRAQQSYRDRKDKYTKALEFELARTRKSEAGLTSEVQQLHERVQMLTILLSQHGISIPADGDGSWISSPDDDTLHLDMLQLTPRNINTAHGQTPRTGVASRDTWAAFAEKATSPDSFWTDENLTYLHQHGSDHLSRDKSLPPIPVHVPPATATTRRVDPGGKTRLCELDATTVGMEFVLTSLESPCLGHIHGNPKKPNEPSGHALTTTSQLHSCLSLPHIDPENPVPPPYQDAPAAVLERLLNLAPSVSGDGDVTPIQAWHYLRRQPFFGGFEMQSIARLAERLRDAAKCHGFGAAVQMGVFEAIMREVLYPVTRVLS
ncbi:hypothetical protein CCMA1212_003041 [Trichoderma ghanense]|uniref:BZIP domain-containing protein n=1 Tax=Trichoderma ghanense TaxID=65468 RepID=A0ABY2HB59_9HYPO